MKDKELEQRRENINEIDNQIMNLLDKRFNEVKKIGDYKKLKNIPITNNEREKEIMDKILSLVNDRNNRTSISNIYKQIINESKNVEK